MQATTEHGGCVQGRAKKTTLNAGLTPWSRKRRKSKKSKKKLGLVGLMSVQDVSALRLFVAIISAQRTRPAKATSGNRCAARA